MELLLFYIYQFRPEIRVAEIIMDHFFYQFVLAYQEFVKNSRLKSRASNREQNLYG